MSGFSVAGGGILGYLVMETYVDLWRPMSAVIFDTPKTGISALNYGGVKPFYSKNLKRSNFFLNISLLVDLPFFEF